MTNELKFIVREITDADGNVFDIGDLPDGTYLKVEGDQIIGAVPPSGGGGGGNTEELIRRTADSGGYASTSWATDAILKRALAAYEKIRFEWWIVYTAGFTSDVQMGINFPAGSNPWYGTHSNLKVAPNEAPTRNVVARAVTDYFEFAGQGATSMLATMVGVVENGATPGDMQLRYSLFGGGSEPVVIKANSLLRVWPIAA